MNNIIENILKEKLCEETSKEMLLEEIQAYIYFYGITSKKIQLLEEFANKLNINSKKTKEIFGIPIEIVNKIRSKIL